MTQDNEINRLIYLFSKLPGLGQRSARRIVLHLLQDPTIRLRGLVQSLHAVDETITTCTHCGNLDTITPCNICTSNDRATDIIAVVETVADLWAMERSGIYNGLYHVLGGTLSVTRGISPDHLRLPLLLKRCMTNNVQEIILATNSTIEGQTTAFYIMEYLKDCHFSISQLASGMPIGGELDYLDEGTLTAALSSRKTVER